MAVEANTTGYVSIGFPSTPGMMVPSDSVIGWVDNDSMEAYVDSFYLSSEFYQLYHSDLLLAADRHHLLEIWRHIWAHSICQIVSAKSLRLSQTETDDILVAGLLTDIIISEI